MRCPWAGIVSQNSSGIDRTRSERPCSFQFQEVHRFLGPMSADRDDPSDRTSVLRHQYILPALTDPKYSLNLAFSIATGTVFR